LSATEPWSDPAEFAMRPQSSGASTSQQETTSPGIAGFVSYQHGISSDLRPVKLSILMSAYNEERTIAQAVCEVLNTKYPCEYELIVIDDGSTDQTGVLLAQLSSDRLIVQTHKENRGKGAALMSALSLASGTHILPFDADLEYAAEDIPKILEPVLKGRCSVVYGVRLFGYNTVYQSLRYAAGNRLMTRMANILFDACLSDLHTCLKLIPLPLLRTLNLAEQGFGLDTEITARLLKRGIRPFEVPVSYYSRSHAQGKKIKWRDALVCAWILLHVRLQRWSRSQSDRGSEAIEDLHNLAAISQHDSQRPGYFRALVINDSANEVPARIVG
jgi:glycosyltransferase involved in cell wall biosynthesis